MDEEKRKGSFEHEKKGLIEQEHHRLPEQCKLLSEQHKQAWLTEQDVYKLPLINHENILRFIAAEKHEFNGRSTLWLVTDYHELGSLLDYLKVNTVTWEQLCHIVLTMARFVKFIGILLIVRNYNWNGAPGALFSVLLLETCDQPFTSISSTTIKPIVLKMCIYVVLLYKTALF